MFYRFKKLFYVWMALVGVFCLVSAKPKNASVTLTSADTSGDTPLTDDQSSRLSNAVHNQDSDKKQRDQSFTVAWGDTPPGDDRWTRLTLYPNVSQSEDAKQGSQSFTVSSIDDKGNVKKYIILGRTRVDGSKIIQLIPLDGHMPDDKANWDEKTNTAPSYTLDIDCSRYRTYCEGNKIWGWTVDEANNLLYTLEQNPDVITNKDTSVARKSKYDFGYSVENASIHMYTIEKDRFSDTAICIPDTTADPTKPTADPTKPNCGIDVTRETDETKQKNITPYFKLFDPSKIIPNTWAMFRQVLDTKYHFTFNYPSVGLALLDGHLFYVDGHTISSAENGLDASITITGDGYDDTNSSLYFKTLSRLATPSSGDVLIASGPTGNIAIVKFDSKARKFTQLFSGSLNKLISDDRFSFPNNFKMAPIPVGSRTQYFLTFTAKNRAHRSEPTSDIPLEVFTLPIAIKSDNNEIDWETSLGSSTGLFASVYDPRKRSGITRPNNTIQTIVSADNTQTTACTGNSACSTQYFTTLYYNTEEPPVFGHSIASAKLFIKRNIPNSSVFGSQLDRTLSDNILGVVFGTPPLYDKSTNVEIENTVSINWATEKQEGKTNGFSVDTFLTLGFTLKGGDPFGSVKSETSFSVFGGYGKNVTQTKTIITDTTKNWVQSTSESEPWGNNKGWFLISSGFDAYDTYRLQGVPYNGTDSPIEPIFDYNGKQVVIYSILPSSNSKIQTEWVTFRLTDGCISGSSEPACQDPHIAPSYFNWAGYSTGMKLPTSSSVVPKPDKTAEGFGTYWDIKPEKQDSSQNFIENETKNNHVYEFANLNIQIGQLNSDSGSGYVNIEDKTTDLTGRIGGSFEEKLTSTVNDFGLSITGSADFKISSEYNYSSTASVKKTNGWYVKTKTKDSPDSVDTIYATAHLLEVTDQTTNKPFWVPDWAWAKGNRPWLLTWTIAKGSQIASNKPNKNSNHFTKTSTNIKNKKTVSSPKSSPAQTTSSIN